MKADEFGAGETWRVFRIMSEFVEGFETLKDLGPAISIFGSARTKKGEGTYTLAQKVAEMLARRGFAIISGGAGVDERIPWRLRRLRRLLLPQGYRRVHRVLREADRRLPRRGGGP